MNKNYVAPATGNEDLMIVDIGEEDFAAIAKTKANHRSHNIIHFVVKGQGVFKTTGSNFTTEDTLTENVAFAVYPRNVVYYQSNPDDPLYYFWVGFDGKESEKILNYVGFSETKPVLTFDNTEKIIQAFRRLISAWQMHQDKYLMFSEFYRLMHILRKNNRSMSQEIVQDTENDIFKRADEYIRRNIHQSIKISELVAELNIDRSYFSKIFKKRFNISPHKHILHLRLHQAKTLLISTNYTITQIVDLLNFADTYSFSKQFKKRFHFSPTEYRKRHKENTL